MAFDEMIQFLPIAFPRSINHRPVFGRRLVEQIWVSDTVGPD